MRLSLSDLRLFVVVAEQANLTHAAALVHLSLTATSTRIRAIEEQAGMALLERQARGVRLTPAGEAFAHHARLMLQQAESLRAELQEYGGGLQGHVRVFANTTAMTEFMPEILAGFLAAQPRVTVGLKEHANHEIARGVREGRADLGIAAGAVDPQGLDAFHFATDRLVLVCARRHRLARRAKVMLAEVLGEAFVGMHEDSTIARFLTRVVEEMGMAAPKLRVQVSSFDAMCRMVEAGVGLGLAPESAAQRHQAAGMGIALVALKDDWALRQRYLLTRQGQRLPAYAHELIARICAHHGTVWPGPARP
ncbi:LysR substrate-binding domain-containing protein [Paucibacter sp. PLA-PC-4]|uniref:LysR substrate-binding domain-containing protein n=1 Tax=Paucibacter sp. PLA-PC-4 TaxID=2993655 RepID=UPI002248CA66|nr:LysR substrate-binding domain-containing protein [Paucibacter sp. PLA-PC-4]MCX2860937.1 LysR substrate-binding domain-containing protein [Paucibacter sp. PLA-PC-4]